MNKFNEMIDHMHMPEEQYEQMKADLARRAGMRNNTPVWRRYAVAAAFAVCLLGTAATAYAAVRYQWFRIFFDNGGQETEIMEELLAKASTETVTAEDDNYKFTVLNHLYSKEQQMGLILCSFHFQKEHHTHLEVLDREYNTVVLKKNRVVDWQTFQMENTNNGDRDLQFGIKDESGEEVISANVKYYTGEMAEDGGYLIGIRYSFDMEKKVEKTPQLLMSLENAGDIEDKLKVSLPESGEVACVRFTSENNPGNAIVISPLGMTLTKTGNKTEMTEEYENVGNLENMKLVMENQVKTIEDMGGGYATSVLRGDMETECTWYTQKEFTNLVDVSEIKYIELDGEKYSK